MTDGQRVSTSSNWSTNSRYWVRCAKANWVSRLPNAAGSFSISVASPSMSTPSVAIFCSKVGIGVLPGRTTMTVRSCESSGPTPACTNDDLPTPEGPTTARNGATLSRLATVSASASRPKKSCASTAVNEARPRYGGRCRSPPREVLLACGGHC